MYYLLTDNFFAPVMKLWHGFKAAELPVQLVTTTRSFRFATERAVAGLAVGDAVNYLALDLPADLAVKPAAFAPSPGLTAKPLSVPVTDYLDQAGRRRLRVTKRYGRLWQVDYFAAAGPLVKQECFDVLGYLAWRRTSKTITDFAADGSARVVKVAATGAFTVYRQSEVLGHADASAGVIACLLDAVYAPGDAVVAITPSPLNQAILAGITQPFQRQLGVAENQGGLPPVLFTLAQAAMAHNTRVATTSQARYQTGEFFFSPATTRDFAYGRRVTVEFARLKGPAKQAYLRDHIGSAGRAFSVREPAFFNVAKHLHVGENFYANRNLMMLDDAPVTIGDNAKIGPDCGFYTSGHPVNPSERNSGFGIARPITIGHNLWMGGRAVVLGGVTLGNNVVIAAGAVVTRSFGDNVVLAGVPARVIRDVRPDVFEV